MMNAAMEELFKEREARVQAAINLKEPDRVPIICSEDSFAWWHAGMSMRDFMFDNEKYMMALEKFHQDFDTDMQFFPPAPLDPFTILVGEPCIIKIPGEDIPDNSVFQLVETEIMKIEDYQFASENGYMQTLVKLLPLLRPGVPDVKKKFMAKLNRAPKILSSNIKRLKKMGVPCWSGGGMESPFGLLSFMRSYTKFVPDLYRRPEIVSRTLDKFTSEIIGIATISCKFASKILRATFGFHREASSYFNLKQFEEFALPQIKKIVNAMSKEGIIAILHCDGDWTPNLPYLTELPKGKCVLDLDDSTDIFKAKEILGDRMCIDGNVMETILTFGTPTRIEKHCRKLIENVGEGGGFILKGEIPITAKIENIKAMIKTVKTHGVYKA